MLFLWLTLWSGFIITDNKRIKSWECVRGCWWITEFISWEVVSQPSRDYNFFFLIRYVADHKWFQLLSFTSWKVEHKEINPGIACLSFFSFLYLSSAQLSGRLVPRNVEASVRLGHKSLRTLMKRSSSWYLPGDLFISSLNLTFVSLIICN